MPYPAYPDWFRAHYGEDPDSDPESPPLLAGPPPAPIRALPNPPPLLRDDSRLVERLRTRERNRHATRV